MVIKEVTCSVCHAIVPVIKGKTADHTRTVGKNETKCPGGKQPV